MTEAHIHEWLGMVVRWAHMITGIAWIGASFYFNWLENQLERRASGDIAGDLWAVHGGGFYYLQKYAVAPEQIPQRLHWFKWEAYGTWVSGMVLLVLVYYWNASTYMLNPEVADISTSLAIMTGLASIFLTWTWYDLLCRSKWGERQWLMMSAMAGWLALLAFVLSELLSGRAAYIHVGAAIGTIMVANVFRVIIPAQKELVTALQEHRETDRSLGEAALLRSRHNNYLTLPVLFIMISSHYPMTYGHPRAWLLLMAISVAGVLIRHYFNVRHQARSALVWLLAGLALLASLAWWTRPGVSIGTGAPGPGVSTASAFRIIESRCVTCHSPEPSNAGFASPPLGIELDSMDKLRAHGERIYTSVVINRTMPLGNLTRITEQERTQLANWFEGRQRAAQDDTDND